MNNLREVASLQREAINLPFLANLFFFFALCISGQQIYIYIKIYNFDAVASNDIVFILFKQNATMIKREATE